MLSTLVSKAWGTQPEIQNRVPVTPLTAPPPPKKKKSNRDKGIFGWLSKFIWGAIKCYIRLAHWNVGLYLQKGNALETVADIIYNWMFNWMWFRVTKGVPRKWLVLWDGEYGKYEPELIFCTRMIFWPEVVAVIVGCMDLIPSICQLWKNYGLCEDKNAKPVMEENCQKTCGFC